MGRTGLTTGSTSSASRDPQGRDDSAILKLQKHKEAGYEEAALAAGMVQAGGVRDLCCLGLASGPSSLGPLPLLDGSPVWKERSEELGSDPVTPRVLIPRGSGCHKVKGHVMFDPAFAFAPEGNEAKAQGY